MRFATIAVVLGSAFSAVATPTVEARGPTVVERDLATVTSVLANVMSKVQALDTAVKAYNGGTNVLALQNANQAVISAVNSGVTAVMGSGDLSESDALQLPGPVQQLVNIIKTSISDLEAKKSMLVAACLAPEVLDDLNMQKTSSNALANAITSKVPTALQGIAKQLSGQITTAIQGGITDFTGTPACSSSSSASSSASKTSSSSSASSSASASSSSSASATSSASSSSASASSTPVSLPGGMMTTPGSSTTPVATSSVSVATSAVSTPTVSPVTGAGSLNSFSAPAAIAAIAAVLAF